MAYSLVGRSAPMAADDSDDDDQWQDGGEDDVRERTAWQDKHSVAACFGCGKTFAPSPIDIIIVANAAASSAGIVRPGRTGSRATRNRSGRATSATTP